MPENRIKPTIFEGSVPYQIKTVCENIYRITEKVNLLPYGNQDSLSINIA
jgi:hypothetical protein